QPLAACASLGRTLDTPAAPADDLTVIGRPNRDRKAERREATRKEILDAAWDAAHESSMPGLTLRDVADRVGMRQPSLYSHFDSKEAIYDTMSRHTCHAVLAALPELHIVTGASRRAPCSADRNSVRIF